MTKPNEHNRSHSDLPARHGNGQTLRVNADILTLILAPVSIGLLIAWLQSVSTNHRLHKECESLRAELAKARECPKGQSGDEKAAGSPQREKNAESARNRNERFANPPTPLSAERPQVFNDGSPPKLKKSGYTSEPPDAIPWRPDK